MDQSYSDSDVSMSPSQILERLHILRQLQLLQQGKLQKQRLQYQEIQESPRGSTLTEIVSQFSTSTSFNTFRSLLESPRDTSTEATPRVTTTDKSPQVLPQDLIDGVSVLNLSQESEFIVNSPVSSRSKVSASSMVTNENLPANKQELAAKKINLDDMPILSPRKDFEALIIEKLKNELNEPKSKVIVKGVEPPNKTKKSFLKKGEGMNRFGIKKNDLVILNTHALPWKQRTSKKQQIITNSSKDCNEKNDNIEIKVTAPEVPLVNENDSPPKIKEAIRKSPDNKITKNITKESNSKQLPIHSIDSSNCELHAPKPVLNIEKEVKIQRPKGKHPLLSNKGKTWAAVLTKEQDDLLRQLKQSDYYKNFSSPTRSVLSDISCDDNLLRLRQDREMAEQNMFDLLENKVSQDSFNINSSFIGRFLKGSDLECSGESTPLIMQRCLSNNPELMRIFPNIHRTRNDHSQSDAGTCDSEYTDCCSEECTSESSCCSCNTVEETPNKPSKNIQKNVVQHDKPSNIRKEAKNQPEIESCQNDNDTDIIKANMAEMNAKLLATSDLLKERLKELEDEIETFRQENATLNKMREEVESDKQKFFEEKAAFEQKFNEEKILSEYYLAEEKEKLTKKKQIYDRQIREMRGRLNKKDKDEVITLKKAINDLKEEIRMKDAKSTTTSARLRNQLKMVEKEKKDLQDEVEKLKKENRRIQHSNDVTRRLSNIKYLEEINKKLNNFKNNSTQSPVEIDDNVKYKAFEIERQSRKRRVEPAAKNPLRTRAKSVPNLNVTSRYAKYFSQRDVLSPTEKNHSMNIETYPDDQFCNEVESIDDIESLQDLSDNENENSLEKIYMERFQKQSRDVQPNVCEKSRPTHSSYDRPGMNENPDCFFFSKSNSSSVRDSRSPKDLSPHSQPNVANTNRSKSPVSILSHRSSGGGRSPVTVTRDIEKPDYMSNYSRSSTSQSRSKSPVSILSHRSSGGRRSPVTVTRDIEKPDYISNYSRSSNSQSRSKSPVSILSNHTYSTRQATVVNRELYDNKMAVSPEPAISKLSVMKTDLKPMEFRKADGTRELRFPNGNVKYISPDGSYSKFVYYNGDIKENFYKEGRIKYYYAEAKTCHTTHPDGLEVLEFPDGQVEKRYKDGSSEIRLPNGAVRYHDPSGRGAREEWRFPDGAALTVAADGERRVVFANGQVEVHTQDHKRREFPDGTVKLVYNDGTSETRYASGRVRIKDKHGHLIMDSVPG